MSRCSSGVASRAVFVTGIEDDRAIRGNFLAGRDAAQQYMAVALVLGDVMLG